MSHVSRILFASPYCLLDTTNGAALATQELLIQLAERGFPCEVVTTSICDPKREVLMDEVLSHHSSAKITKSEMIKDVPCIEVNDGVLPHTILMTRSSHRPALRSAEEEALLSLVERRIGEFQPNLLLTYGGLQAERRIHRLARQHKIPVAFYLHNSVYKRTETFTDVDLILVPSKFLSDFYKERLRIQSRVLFPIFTSNDYIVQHRNPRFITFINPAPDKGLTLFARLVAESLRKLPQAEFLVVEGRWTQADVAQAGLRLNSIPNVKVLPHQQTIKTVYAETRILLYPSFWVEAFGRIVVEAQMNGIPVLANRWGGIPEALNGGGFLFDVPDRCTKNYMALPTPEEVQPWIDQLRVLLEDKEAYNEAQRRALQAAEDFRPEKIVQKAIDLFNELLHK